MGSAGSVRNLADLGGLPAPPAEHLSPYLDAAARCIIRFGGSRTRVRDVALEAGVERTTIYRHLGPMEEVFRLLLARELHRLLGEVTANVPIGLDGPGTVVEVVVRTVELAREHPVMAKLLADEPDLVARHLCLNLGDIVSQIGAALAPGLATAARFGFIAPVDAAGVAEWIARVGVTFMIAPPAGDLRVVLAAVLRPLLDPAQHKTRPTSTDDSTVTDHNGGAK